MAVYTFEVDLDAGGGSPLEVAAGINLEVEGASGLFMPAPWTAKPSLVDYSRDLIPPLGYRAQRIARLGSRFSVTFSTLPALAAAAALGLQAVRAKARANGETLVFLWPQPAFSGIGSPVVSGAGQLGTSLAVSGLTAGASLPAGSFFSFSSGGRNYLHMTTAATTASGGGTATLAIAPMLRTSPAAGSTCNFTTPAIEGFVQGGSEDASLQVQLWTGFPSFTVPEAS